jgi:trigger factor
MNFTKQQVDDLNAIVKVKVQEEDYASAVEKILKDYQKKANMPGFRPGKVPVGMIKKMYYKPVLVDEINKLLNQKISGYIQENKLEVLGQPLPRIADDSTIDWDNQKEFEFAYDLGLSPKFEVDLSHKEKFNYYLVKVEDRLTDKYVNDIAKRYGKLINPEVSESGDLLFGDFQEVDANGQNVEGGVSKTSTLALDTIKDEAIKKQFVGISKGASVTIDPKKAAGNPADMAAMLGITQDAAQQLNNPVKFTITNISRMEPAELNIEFFKKVYGDEVNTVEQFRERVNEELKGMYLAESERKFKNDVVLRLVKSLNLNLPDEFLKRWLVAANEKPVTLEQVSSEYKNYSDALRWQLIENKILQSNQINVSNEEVVDYTKSLIRKQFARFNQNEMDEQELNNTAQRVLGDEKESRRLFEKLYDEKLMTLFKASFTVTDKEISEEDFYKLSAE